MHLTKKQSLIPLFGNKLMSNHADISVDPYTEFSVSGIEVLGGR